MNLFPKVFAALCMAGALAVPAFAHQSALDEENLKSAVASRINMLLAGQPGGASRTVSSEDVRLDKKQPVSVQGIPLYAVRLLLTPRAQGKDTESPPDEMVFLTDPTGTVQFGMVTDIKTGREIAMAQATDLTRISFPSHLAESFLAGQGKREVVFISDPFCPYCRQAYLFLKDQLSAISTLSLAHLPLPMHPGADAAVWMMKFAHETAPALHEAVVEFAYTALMPATAASLDESQKQVIAQFLKRFPELSGQQEPEAFYFYLKGKYEANTATAVKDLQKLRITGTPVVLIDGQPVHGFNKQEIAARLAE